MDEGWLIVTWCPQVRNCRTAIKAGMVGEAGSLEEGLQCLYIFYLLTGETGWKSMRRRDMSTKIKLTAHDGVRIL